MNSLYIAIGVMAAVVQVYCQCIPPCAGITPVYSPGCGCAPTVVGPCPVAAPVPVLASPTVIQANSVAANLADTLSLLTVSSLLAETLPYGYPVVAPPVYPGCGCGYGYVL